MDKIKTLEIDIETFSDADLGKCGVYRYTESPCFEILLFGYSVNDGPVQVVDLASGEDIPDNIINALTDNSVIKWAHNASFERICLSAWLRKNKPSKFAGYGRSGDFVGNYLDPAGWRCSMVWSAYMGLPLSLKDVGAVLKLEDQKLSEGKDLVRYFCIPCRPTATNSGRTRNMPSDAPADWALFKKYNARDVEVEQSITHRLSKHPVPESVWEEYHISEEINDRGIGIDITLVDSAIDMDARSRQELMDAMREITELENPNSAAQLKDWLCKCGLEIETLGKKEVAAIIKEAPPELQKVLSLRLQLSKSSVKKYQAMQNCVCADGRARGMFQFYGANRTGRWCLTGDHEVLTPDGWRRLDEWNGGYIACWNAASEQVSFQKSEAVAFDYDGPMYTYHDCRIDQCSTPDHKMRVKRRYDAQWSDMTVAEMATCQPTIPLYGYMHQRGCPNPAWLRVLIMTQADGFYTADGGLCFHFKKLRKIERCKALLRRAEVPFVVHSFKDVVTISIPARAIPLWLREFRTKTFGFWLLEEDPDIFFDELPNWDGYRPAPNSIQYSTCCKQNADIVQALAHMSGRAASMRVKHHSESKANWKDAYVVDIGLDILNSHTIRTKPIVSEFCGKVYCAVTQTGYFLVRRNGKVWVTGNSGRNIQMQNLPQNHLPDLDAARALVRAGDYDAVQMLYEDVPDTLSQLIRTAFIAPKGKQFCVADFSAIEARVIAWLAGEQWRMDLFRNGGDIYCQSASQMFKVPVEKHGVNGHLRQKGKIAELACGYGGSVGALKAMGALEMGLKEEELSPLVKAWRESNHHIVQLWWEVENAAITAITEHSTSETHGLVFTWCKGMLFVTLPSGRQLSYARPRVGTNQYGSPSISYYGVDGAKKWNQIETFGGKLVENIIQAIARDVLCYTMQTLNGYFICAHVHDEVIIEAGPETSLEEICEMMGRTPPWAEGLILRADGYTTPWYQKKD